MHGSPTITTIADTHTNAMLLALTHTRTHTHTHTHAHTPRPADTPHENRVDRPALFPPTFLYTQSWEDPEPDMKVGYARMYVHAHVRMHTCMHVCMGGRTPSPT